MRINFSWLLFSWHVLLPFGRTVSHYFFLWWIQTLQQQVVLSFSLLITLIRTCGPAQRLYFYIISVFIRVKPHRNGNVLQLLFVLWLSQLRFDWKPAEVLENVVCCFLMDFSLFAGFYKCHGPRLELPCTTQKQKHWHLLKQMWVVCY